MLKGHYFLAAVLTALLVAPAQADVLLIDAIKAAPTSTSDGQALPHRGMTMAQVRARNGEPTLAHSPIGAPPITRWDYPEYSVFFEHQYVLDTVVHHKP